jgi:hypothetical protein
MKKILLLILLFSFPFKLSAQHLTQSRQTSYYTYIFQLKDREAKRIYRKDLYVVDKTYFHTVIDSFPTGKQYEKALPYGHYLLTYADGGDLMYELTNRFAIQPGFASHIQTANHDRRYVCTERWCKF